MSRRSRSAVVLAAALTLPGPVVLAPILAALALPGPAALAAQQPAPPPGAYEAAPYLGEIRNEVLYGDIWERPQLSARDRSLVTVTVNQALYATEELRIHMNRALDNGVTQAELSELIPHVLWYAGFPTGVTASVVASEVFRERGLPDTPPGYSPRESRADADPEFPGVLQATPYLTELLNQVLYAETWERTELSPRDRSLITIAVNTALYRTGEIRTHVARGLDNGLSREQVSEIIHHVAWYAGFPPAVNASRVAAGVFEDRGLPLPDSRFPGAPYLDTLIDDVVYGDAWEREELSPRDRSLATIAMTQGQYQTDQLRVHLGRGLDNGLTPEELSELMAHVTLYSGFPAGVNGSRLLAELFRERGVAMPEGDVAGEPGPERVLELRTYTTHPGRLDALLARFRNHTRAIFDRHDMHSVGYWVPTDGPESENTLIYMLAHPSREAAEENWEAFLSDPEWLRVRAESRRDGDILMGVESTFLEPTDFSRVR